LAPDLASAWKLAARTDRARRRLDAARTGIVIPAPRTKRNLAIGAFAALATIGKAVSRALSARAALAKAQIVNAARRAARMMRLAARRALRLVTLAAITLTPSVAAAHPGHDGHGTPDMNAGGLVVLVGVTLGLAAHAWATWGPRVRALATADSGVPMAGGSAPEPEPTSNGAPEPRRCRCAEPSVTFENPQPCRSCGGQAPSDEELDASDPLQPYHTVRIPYVASGATKWHPTTDTGPFSQLTRGCYRGPNGLADARAWADSHLDGHPYTVALVTFDRALDNDRVETVYTFAGVQS
jgi:hypothetical protein